MHRTQTFVNRSRTLAGTTRLNRFSHLATITSQEENDFVTSLLQPFGFGWLGGIQTSGALSPSDGWSWVTGEPLVFTKWAPGEPNDFPFDEIFLEINETGYWNDCCGPTDVTRPLYVAEWVPIPPAVWLFGSGLLGLIGIARRKKVA